MVLLGSREVAGLVDQGEYVTGHNAQKISLRYGYFICYLSAMMTTSCSREG